MSGDGMVLVTGGAGFIGSNLVDRLAGQGRRVMVYDLLARPGVERNLEWLVSRHGDLIQPIIADVRDHERLANVAGKAGAVFHMAAQVAVTTSMVDPLEDHQINVGATFALLEALRRKDDRTPIVFASTNKVYGDLADIPLELIDGAYQPADPQVRDHGIGEDRPLDFHTPYGCSKGAADQYVLDYARSFGVPSCVFRMSCIYGPRQMGTEDQGWVAHFAIRALEGRKIILFGDGRQVRDILHVRNAVDAYMAALHNVERLAGRAFNLGGGPANAVSLRQILAHIETLAGRSLDIDFDDWRPGDQRYFVADCRRARAELGLADPLGWREGVADLISWLESERPAIDRPALAGAAA